MAALHQFVLDCGATFTNELYKMTEPTFVPFTGQFARTKALAEKRIRSYCVDKDVRTAAPQAPAPTTPQSPAVSASPAAPATTSSVAPAAPKTTP